MRTTMRPETRNRNANENETDDESENENENENGADNFDEGEFNNGTADAFESGNFNARDGTLHRGWGCGVARLCGRDDCAGSGGLPGAESLESCGGLTAAIAVEHVDAADDCGCGGERIAAGKTGDAKSG